MAELNSSQDSNSEFSAVLDLEDNAPSYAAVSNPRTSEISAGSTPSKGAPAAAVPILPGFPANASKPRSAKISTMSASNYYGSVKRKTSPYNKSTNTPKKINLEGDLPDPQQIEWQSDFFQYILFESKYKRRPRDTLTRQEFPEEGKLANWFRRNLAAYKTLEKGRNSSIMTHDQKLVFHDVLLQGKHMIFKKSTMSSQQEQWDKRYTNLREFWQQNGHCNVKQRDGAPGDPNLGHWVKAQRELMREKERGVKNSLTKERIELLDAIGFEWRS